MRADFRILIFSLIFSCWTGSVAMGWRSFVDDLSFSPRASFFARKSFRFSRAAAILHCSQYMLHRKVAGYAPVFPEGVLSPLANFAHPLHCLDCRLDEIAVVANRNIAAFLEFESRVLSFGQVGWGQRRRYVRTMTISLPCALRKALVHRTLRGLRFILRNISK
jgi:hypothetical protein